MGVSCGGPGGYLLRVEVPVRSVLGSLSEPGIFQGPGETVAFLPAALLLFWGRLGRLSPRLLSDSPCCTPPYRSTSPLLVPLVCGSCGDSVDSLWRFLSLDLPLVLLEGLGSPLPSPSVVCGPLGPLWVDLPPSFLALLLPLLPWLVRSWLGSSAFWGLFGRSVLPTGSRGTSRGDR